MLLEHGAGINTHSNEFKESALTLACYKGMSVCACMCVCIVVCKFYISYIRHNLQKHIFGFALWYSKCLKPSVVVSSLNYKQILTNY